MTKVYWSHLGSDIIVHSEFALTLHLQLSIYMNGESVVLDLSKGPVYARTNEW